MTFAFFLKELILTSAIYSTILSLVIAVSIPLSLVLCHLVTPPTTQRHILYLGQYPTPNPWPPPTREPTIHPYSTVILFFSVHATLLAHCSHILHPPDDAFAARHMPNLGHDVKDFKVFHWKLQGWRKLERKLISPEFDCGGHQWYGLPGHCRLSQSRNLKFHSGGYSSFRSAIITTPLQTTPSLSISSTPTLERVRTYAPNSRWSSQTPTIPQYIPSVVCS